MRLASGSFSHTGLVRGNNEDSFVVDNEHVLFAVADGMGGHRGGEVASRTAIEALRAAVAAGRTVQDAITSANEAVIERARNDAELTGMGTTLTAVVDLGSLNGTTVNGVTVQEHTLTDGDVIGVGETAIRYEES